MNWKSKFNDKRNPTVTLPEGYHRLSDGRIVTTAQAIAFKEELEKRRDAFRPPTSRIPEGQIVTLPLPKVDPIP